jgi:Na+/proline symporter
MPYGLMAQALIALDFAAFLALTAVAGTGYGIARGWVAAERHMLLAIPAALFQLFGHSLTMFYFIGTGRRIKEWAAATGGNPEVLARVRAFKSRVFPSATLALALVIAVFVLGGGTSARVVPRLVHGAAAIAALLAAGVALYREAIGIAETVILMRSLPSEEATPAEGAPAER